MRSGLPPFERGTSTIQFLLAQKRVGGNLSAAQQSPAATPVSYSRQLASVLPKPLAHPQDAERS
jgi:hypothetical protein